MRQKNGMAQDMDVHASYSWRRYCLNLDPWTYLTDPMFRLAISQRTKKKPVGRLVRDGAWHWEDEYPKNLTSWIEAEVGCFGWWIKDTVGRNPSPVHTGKYTIIYKVSYISSGWEWDFSYQQKRTFKAHLMSEVGSSVKMCTFRGGFGDAEGDSHHLRQYFESNFAPEKFT